MSMLQTIAINRPMKTALKAVVVIVVDVEVLICGFVVRDFRDEVFASRRLAIVL